MSEFSKFSEDTATAAEFFLRGIEVKLLTDKEAKDWAFQIIESQTEPPSEIIEIAMSGSLPEILSVLKQVPGVRDSHKVGRWLLTLLAKKYEAGLSEAGTTIRSAMQIVRSTSMGDDDYYKFDRIDDGLNLAVSGVYGTTEECYADLREALSEYNVDFEIRYNLQFDTDAPVRRST